MFKKLHNVYGFLRQGPQIWDARATKFCAVAPDICGSPVWNLLGVILLGCNILKWSLYFWKTCTLLCYFYVYSWLAHHTHTTHTPHTHHTPHTPHTPTHYKTHTYTHSHTLHNPHIHVPHTLQNPCVHTPTHYKTHTPTHYKTHAYTHPHITKPTHTHTHTLHNTPIHPPHKIHTK
jgi:hypothetical protein